MATVSELTAIQPIPYFPLVASLPDWAKSPKRDQESLEILHAPMFYLPRILKPLDGFWLYRSVLNALLNLKRAGKLDIVDAHFGYPEGVGLLRAARKIGVPCVVTLRGFEAEYLHKPLIGRQIKHLLQNADGYICVGHFMRELALENGADAKKICVIHNAIDETQFFPADRNGARKKLGMDTDAPIVISVGHLIERKRHHVLVSAFAEVLEARPDARLLIIGSKDFDVPYAKRLKEQLSELGIGESVELLGNVNASDIGDYLRAANVFALGTQREGCCNAVLEALACGLPVVTTPVGDNTWFVDDGVNGHIVPVDDIQAMSAALSKAIEKYDWDPHRISTTLDVGNWGRVAGEVMEFLEVVVSSKHISNLSTSRK